MRVIICLIALFFLSCEPLVTQFEELDEAVYYQAAEITTPPDRTLSLTVVTWNIRFGAGRIDWYIDSCGDRVLLTEKEVVKNLETIAREMGEMRADILLLQEVDRNSKRSAYIDQIQWLLDHTELNYGVYAPILKSQFIPSDGLGRMDQGNVILSRWKISAAERIQLALRGAQSALTQYFWARRNIIRCKIKVPGNDNFWAVNVHTAAFSTDDTKEKHVKLFKSELDELDGIGATFVGGGDFNTIPPGSEKTEYCDEDRCPSEALDQCGDGLDYTMEQDWLASLYGDYTPAVALEDYLMDNSSYFTHNRSGTDWWDRKLDYLFTNGSWANTTGATHQDMFNLSDHAPVSAELLLTQ